jgi:hypothetical protein
MRTPPGLIGQYRMPVITTVKFFVNVPQFDMCALAVSLMPPCITDFDACACYEGLT